MSTGFFYKPASGLRSFVTLNFWASAIFLVNGACRPQKTESAKQKIVMGTLASQGAPTELIPKSTVFVSARIPMAAGEFMYDLCTGTLISEKRILTAAHCVDDQKNPQEYRVFYGQNEWPKELRRGAHRSQSVGVGVGLVTQIRVHPRTDLATLDLASPAQGTVVFAALPEPQDVRFFDTATPSVVAGFGVYDQPLQEKVVADNNGNKKTAPEYQDISDIDITKLRWTSVNYHRTLQRSELKSGGIYENLLSFRANSSGGNACRGDSGGPTFSALGGQWKLVGVTSNGAGYCVDTYNNVVNLFDEGFQNWIYEGISRPQRPILARSAPKITPAVTVTTAQPPVQTVTTSGVPGNTDSTPTLPGNPLPMASQTEPEFVENCPSRPALRKDFLTLGFRFVVQTKRATSVVRGASNPGAAAYADTAVVPPCAEVYARQISTDGTYFWAADDLKVVSVFTGRQYDFPGRRYLAKAQYEKPSTCAASGSCIPLP